MDKTNLFCVITQGVELSEIASMLTDWWGAASPRPKLTFVLRNAPSCRAATSKYVEWPRLMVGLQGTRCYQLCDESGERLRLAVGQAIYFSPGTWISPFPARRIRSLGIHWEAAGVRLVLREGSPFDRPKEVWHLPTMAGLPAGWSQRLAAFAARPSGRCAAEGMLLAQTGLLIDGCSGAVPRPGRRQRLFLRICSFLEETFTERHSRESVAEHFGISSGYLTRLFREEGGTGFNAYLNRLRLQEAERLLENTHRSVQEIASRCGIPDAAYFSRLFRRRLGSPPTADRKA
ncbi:MAG TPA: AraC family transcriptional regulator [Chthoniobacteraceae bacterium]|nr:AraC family transcriptional regulator [Chthoniobacteraceae bacterium]